MARWVAEKTIVKKVGELTIIFYDKETIYAREGDGEWVVFHRWGVRQRYFYMRNWKPFRQYLMVEKRITLKHCYRLAFWFEISSQTVAKEPDLTGRKIEERNFTI